jgi:hypothetical protein
MKGLTRHALWILVAGVTGCASEPPASSGDICGQIAHFANSPANDHLVHWVEYTADRKCSSDNSEQGQQLCQFLTTTPSPDVDRQNALACLRDTMVERYTQGQVTTVRYTARLVQQTDRKVMVRVEYPADTEVKSSLKISAVREAPRWVREVRAP